jgi:hypothetical protein
MGHIPEVGTLHSHHCENLKSSVNIVNFAAYFLFHIHISVFNTIVHMFIHLLLFVDNWYIMCKV